MVLKLLLLYSNNNFSNNFMIESNQTFKVGRKKIDASKLQMGIGKRIHGIKPQITIFHKFRGRWHFYLSGSYLLRLQSEDMLYIREKSGFFLIRKKAKIKLSDENLTLRINDVETNRSNLKIGNFFFSFGVCFKL